MDGDGDNERQRTAPPGSKNRNYGAKVSKDVVDSFVILVWHFPISFHLICIS